MREQQGQRGAGKRRKNEGGGQWKEIEEGE
jgi:hypothetical protein